MTKPGLESVWHQSPVYYALLLLSSCTYLRKNKQTQNSGSGKTFDVHYVLRSNFEQWHIDQSLFAVSRKTRFKALHCHLLKFGDPSGDHVLYNHSLLNHMAVITFSKMMIPEPSSPASILGERVRITTQLLVTSTSRSSGYFNTQTRMFCLIITLSQ